VLADPGRAPFAVVRRVVAWACWPAAVIVLWVLALRNGIGGDFFYDEAVYANLGQHPFRSDYYFDPVFFRHPPFVHLFYFALGRLLPWVRPEVLFRVAGLLFASLGLALWWRASAALVRSLALRALSLLAMASSPLFVRYSLSATMYPFAFCFLQAALYGLAARRARWRTAGFTLLLYTHYWGHAIYACALLARWLQGRTRAELREEMRPVLAATAPLALMTLVGLVFHASRVRLHNVPSSLSLMAFHVPAAVWGGLVALGAAFHRDWRPAREHEAVLTGAVAVAMFVLLAAVAPPFERYLYLFLPIFLLCGSVGIERMTGSLGTGGLHAAMIAMQVPLYFLPGHLLARAEPALFPNYFADNNRFAHWRQPVEICGVDRVLTNNARSFAYYLAAREHTQPRLDDLVRAGRLRQFEDVDDLARQARAAPPDWIVIDRVPAAGDVVAYVRRRLPACHRAGGAAAGEGEADRLWDCRPPVSGAAAATR
jgi:hypothetical protein